MDIEARAIDIEIIAGKASTSLESRKDQIIRDWLKAVIDDLDLESLMTLPTGELSSAFPQLIGCITDGLRSSTKPDCHDGDLRNMALILSDIRKGNLVPAKIFDDYEVLKKLMLEAAAGDLRNSDIHALALFLRFERSFMQFFRTGLEVFFEQQSQELRRMADTDGLTGLYNVRYFNRHLDESLEMFRRYRLPFSLIMMDIDKLKQLNDTEGHRAGDMALVRLAEVMLYEKRETDIAVRSGGDEFFMLMPGIPENAAEAMARRMAEAIRAAFEVEAAWKVIGVSMGVVSCPVNGTDADTLRAKADEALYRAKKNGGQSVYVFREE